MKNSHVDWNYTSVNDNYTSQYTKSRAVEMTRGKMLGGSSSLNFMVYVRGNPHDFDVWADTVKDKNWKYEKVLPYFKKSERLTDSVIRSSHYGAYHNYKGYMGVQRQYHPDVDGYMQAYKELGNKIVIDTSTGDLGYTQPLFTISDGTRQSTSNAFLSPIKDRTNLHVWKNTLVTKIIFDRKKNAVAIEALTSDNRKLTVKARREIIVSAGSINTPQLLMLSGIGPRKHLQEMAIPVISDLPVGENFHDHQGVPLAFKMGKLPSFQPPQNPHEIPVPVIIGYAALNRTQSYPDYQNFDLVLRNPAFLLGFCTFVFGLEDALCRQLNESCESHEVLLAVPNTMHPKSRGKILLKSKDPKDYPLIHGGYYSNPDDLENQATYIEDVIRVINTTYFKKANAELVRFDLPACAGYEWGSREYWKCYSRELLVTVYHYTGTCAMGSVVDSRLRVSGVRRLRVVDASVMPFITSGNINAPTIMIGEKGADMIKEDNNIVCSCNKFL
ncbi:unnamed protein product [Diatraea saccharalis]|uniref:Glucose-methanol-choline oxidoreductase N-terminal domain-containing protein n=1 Tax=Diatraea saccharalis TaxID=40085 RepID=A0A9N9QZH0_9NEOP|nr:unnamed protein product [Diatraea saccharalis]